MNNLILNFDYTIDIYDYQYTVQYGLFNWLKKRIDMTWIDEVDYKYIMGWVSTKYYMTVVKGKTYLD